MRIAILSIYSFPYGMAATNRIAAYSRGLVEAGATVDVITIFPTEPYNPEYHAFPNKGVFNGVHYIHPSGRYRSRFKILRALAFKSGLRFWRGVHKVRQILRKNCYDAVIMSFDEPKWLKTYTSLIHRYGAKAIFIFDEYPIPIRHQLLDDIPEWKKQAYRSVLFDVDGYISITEELVGYYSNFALHPSLQLPVIVDTEKFRPSEIEKDNKITYIGNMELSKDNVDNIAESFALIAKDHPDWTLHFYGPERKDAVKAISRIAEQNGLSKRIIIEGPADSEAVPGLIAKSKIMVSSQPDTTRAKGGFPTKLGEYVAMGVPTLLCDVGENKKYITENDCFYANPSNAIDYSAKLSAIISDYDTALEIARHGRNTIIQNFSHTAAGNKIMDFINRL